MSRRFFRVLLSGSILLALLLCKKTQVTPQESAAVLTQQDLVGKSWVPSGVRNYVDLTFTDKVARFEVNFEGQSCGVADYKITGNSVEIGKTRRCTVEDFVGLTEQEAQTCAYVFEPKAIQHTVLLKCKTGIFGRADSLVKAGTPIEYEGLKLVSEGWASAEATTPAKFRSKPEKSGPTIAYDPGNDIEGPKPKTDVIAEGKTVTLIARTVEKHRVEKWENYWYLVEVYGLENYRGWVFGELIRKK